LTIVVYGIQDRNGLLRSPTHRKERDGWGTTILFTLERKTLKPRKRKKRHSLRVALLRFLHWSLASQKILADGIFRRAYRSYPRPVHPF
jgi:hypothetical protein